MAKSTQTAEYRSLRALLVKTREEAGLTQRALAERLRKPHSWVAKVESGERRIDLVEFCWFCQGCDANPIQVGSSIMKSISYERKRRAR